MRVSAGEALVIDMNLQYMLRFPTRGGKLTFSQMFPFPNCKSFPYEPFC